MAWHSSDSSSNIGPVRFNSCSPLPETLCKGKVWNMSCCPRAHRCSKGGGILCKFFIYLKTTSWKDGLDLMACWIARAVSFRATGLQLTPVCRCPDLSPIQQCPSQLPNNKPKNGGFDIQPSQVSPTTPNRHDPWTVHQPVKRLEILPIPCSQAIPSHVPGPPPPEPGLSSRPCPPPRWTTAGRQRSPAASTTAPGSGDGPAAPPTSEP